MLGAVRKYFLRDVLGSISIPPEVRLVRLATPLLVPEASFRPGGDAFKDAVRFLVKRPDSADGPPDEIDDPVSRAAESLLVRHLFPSFPSKCEHRNVPLMVVPDAGSGTPAHGDAYRFRFEFTGKPPGGGDLASHRHEGQYVGIVSERAPFGGYQLWMTNGITVESGDCLTASRDDVTITMMQNSMQIPLMESGTGAKSQFKDQNDANASVSGVVMLNGQAVADAVIEFVPAGGKAQSVRSKTDESGKFELKLRPSENRVRIRPAEKGQARQSIPPRYSTDTPLRAEVKAGRNEFNFELQSP